MKYLRVKCLRRSETVLLPQLEAAQQGGCTTQEVRSLEPVNAKDLGFLSDS